MQLSFEIGLDQLIKIISDLPGAERDLIKTKLDEIDKQGNSKEKKNEFQKFLLKGPLMSDEQYKEFIENRKKMNQWRIE